MHTMVCVSPVDFGNPHDVLRFVVGPNGRPVDNPEAMRVINGNYDVTDNYRLRERDLLTQMEHTWHVALYAMEKCSRVNATTVVDRVVQPVLCALGCDQKSQTGCSFMTRHEGKNPTGKKHPASVSVDPSAMSPVCGPQR